MADSSAAVVRSPVEPKRAAGAASSRAAGNPRSTSATSSSPTSRPTPATTTSWRPANSTLAVWGSAAALLPRGDEEGRARRRRRDALVAPGARAGLHRPRQRGDRRPADRQAVPAGDHAHRRLRHGRDRAEGRRPSSPTPRCARPSPSTARRTTTASSTLHAGDPRVPALRHHHRPAGRLRARPHHRRLPARRALRRRPPDRGQEGRARRRSTTRWPTEEVMRTARGDWPTSCARSPT